MSVSNSKYRESLLQGFARSLQVQSNNIPSLLTEKQVATVLDLQRSTLAVWRCTGRYNLPFVKIGRKARYPIDGVIDFLVSRTKTHTGM